jgi:HEAT repeat protein
MPTPDEILRALTDVDALLNRAALTPFSHLDTAADLADAWDELSPPRRREVVSSLVEMAEEDAQLDFESVFRDRLEDADAEVRALAVGGLWESENPVLIKRLTRLLTSDPSAEVQAAAAQGLGKFARLVALGRLRETYQATLAETLLPIFRDDSRALPVRRRALEAVAPLPLPEVAEAIHQAYASDDAGLRISALYAMGAACEADWLPTLNGELDSPDAEVRYEAATALGEIGEENSLRLLQTRLTDADLEVQLAAITAIGKIGGPAAKKMLQNFRTGENEVLAEAVTDALEEIAQDDDPMQYGL